MLAFSFQVVILSPIILMVAKASLIICTLFPLRQSFDNRAGMRGFIIYYFRGIAMIALNRDRQKHLAKLIPQMIHWGVNRKLI